jgi:Fe-S cluster assembly ATP-binding protein
MWIYEKKLEYPVKIKRPNATLAKLIMGIEKPTSGQILLDGVDVTNMSINERANLGIGYAFQQPPRFKGMTVRALLSLAHGSELPEHECCTYLTNVGLCSKEYLNREVDTGLSGGEVKRIEIATLMARTLKLAIYDEPEAGIDLWSFAMLVDSFRAISKNKHESVIIISHQERIMKLADEIVILENGRIKKQGAQEELFSAIISELQNDCDFGK